MNGQLAPTHAIINIVVVDAGRNCTLEFVMEHTSEYFFGFYWAELAEYLIESVADKKLLKWIELGSWLTNRKLNFCMGCGTERQRIKSKLKTV